MAACIEAPEDSAVEATVGERRTFPNLGAAESFNPHFWSLGVGAAAASRQSSILDILAVTQDRWLRWGGSPSVEALVRQAVRAYLAGRRARAVPNDLLVHIVQARRLNTSAAIGATPGEDPDAAFNQALLGLLDGLVRLHFALGNRFAFAKEAVAFNAQLADAVFWHKTVFSSLETPARAIGLIAWEPLALACLAQVLGVRITVSTDYLPTALLDGQLVRGRDTPLPVLHEPGGRRPSWHRLR